MGSGPRGARPPSHVAYYVALVGVLGLLILLICYFAYFCVKRVKELVVADPAWVTATPARPTPSYPVQPVVREGASAMAKLCKQLPPPRGGTVFPAPDEPAAIRPNPTEPDSARPDSTGPNPTGPDLVRPDSPPAAPSAPLPKTPAPAATHTRIEITPAS